MSERTFTPDDPDRTLEGELDLRRMTSSIDAALRKHLDALDASPELLDAMGYALLGGGKRLRPVLAWLACEAVGGDGERSLPAGVAIEMVHAFSLVHDDLPAMDDDDLRRGQPTLHVRSGEAMAILAGDALLSCALEALTEVPNADLSRALTRELASATRQMIDGQVLDTMGSQRLTSLEPLEQVRTVHGLKTGALIKAALRMGGMCGLAASEKVAAAHGTRAVEALTAYGTAIGQMFQAVDDLLDVVGHTSAVGKGTGKDAAAGKRTYPGLLGVEATRTLISQLEDEACRAIRPLGEPARRLEVLARMLSKREQ